MDALERLYIRLERWEPLKDVYAKKADLAEDPEDKKAMLYVLAQVYDRELGDVAKAIETYQGILDIDADQLESHRRAVPVGDGPSRRFPRLGPAGRCYRSESARALPDQRHFARPAPIRLLLRASDKWRV